MKFRTEYVAKPSSLILSPEKPMVMAGSCFTQNIAEKMKECLWVTVNPFGTLYNPLSIAKAIEMMLEMDGAERKFEETLFLYNGIWNSHYFDSSISSKSRKDCVEEFKHRRELFLENLEKGKTLIITFGTSICYFLKATGDVAGNCHKQPSDLYLRRRITTEEIVATWENLIGRLQDIYPEIKFIFTVSPVRHLKDGFVGNNRSKAVLSLAIEELCEKNPECHYFPAYEILNDDLRDYRFYATDLLHPSEEGIEYIWEKFCDTYLDSGGLQMLQQGLQKFKAMNHRGKTGALGKLLQ